MELVNKLSELLLPYKDVIATGAIGVTMLQLLAPAMLINEIRKRKSAENESILPFVGGGVLSILYIQFGSLMRDDATIKINFMGLLLSIIYISIFYFYTPLKQKVAVWGKIGMAGAFAASLIAYTIYEDPEKVEMRYGLILTCILYCLIASPMIGLGDVIKNKSTAKLPFPMIFTGFFVGLSWLLYGFCLGNIFVIAQNLVAFFLSAFQLSLFVIYPSKSVAKDIKKTK